MVGSAWICLGAARDADWAAAVDIPNGIAYNTVMSRYQIVIDTNVLVSALRSKRGASYRLLMCLGDERFDIHISVPLILRLPESLHQQLRELAKRENVSMNQFVTLALAEKIAALSTEDYLLKRAERGDRRKFDRAMDRVADVEPPPYDTLR